MSKDFFATDDAGKLLASHGLDSFESLWELRLDAVDAPNTSRGGWSSVYRLDLADSDGRQHGYYLKRQDNHLTRSLSKPFGEPTFAREYRAIREYNRAKVPALEAVAFAQRRLAGRQCALLVTRALDDHEPLDHWLSRWNTLSWRQRSMLIGASAELVSKLHRTGRVHNCLYPKHIFLKLDDSGASARLIDLEKTRRAWFGRQDLVSDLATLSRRSAHPGTARKLRFLLAYLGKRGVDTQTRGWVRQIHERILRKAAG